MIHGTTAIYWITRNIGTQYNGAAFLFFPIVKMAANYAKINRVGTLDAGFQHVPIVQNVWNFHNIVMEHQSFKIWS